MSLQRHRPGFHHVDRITVNGFAGGSSALATGHQGGVQQGDVFVSASPAVNLTLAAPRTGVGELVREVRHFPARARYNPKSTSAPTSRAPWYKVVTKPGFFSAAPIRPSNRRASCRPGGPTPRPRNEKDPRSQRLSSTATVSRRDVVGALQCRPARRRLLLPPPRPRPLASDGPLVRSNSRPPTRSRCCGGTANAANARAFVRYLLGRRGGGPPDVGPVRSATEAGRRGAPSALARLASSG